MSEENREFALEGSIDCSALCEAKFREATQLIGQLQVDEERVIELLRFIYANGDRWWRYLAKITQVHLKLSAPNGPWPHPKETVGLLTRTARHTLDAIAEDFSTAPPHRLNFEVEWRLLFARLSIAEILRDYEKMDALASHAVTLAELRDNPPLLREAQARQADILMKIGKYSESMQILMGESSEIATHADMYYEHWKIYDLTHNLMNLGATGSALKFIDDALIVNPNDSRLLGRKYWFQLISGHLHNPAPPEHPAWSNQMIQSEILYHVTLAEQFYPFKVRTLLKRNEHLFKTLDLLRGTLENGSEAETDLLFARWLRGRVRLEGEEYGLALQEVARLPEIKQEELLNRLLISGLILELGMSPAPLPSGMLVNAVKDLQAVFALARTLPYAEPHSLARILLRWHPHAAAICALITESIPELESATQNMIKTSGRTTWRSRALPTGVAEFISRRALKLPTTTLKLGGNALSQVSRLKDQDHRLNIQGPFISSIAVMVGLIRMNEVDVAKTVTASFGLEAQVENDPDLTQLVVLALTSGPDSLNRMIEELRTQDFRV